MWSLNPILIYIYIISALNHADSMLLSQLKGWVHNPTTQTGCVYKFTLSYSLGSDKPVHQSSIVDGPSLKSSPGATVSSYPTLVGCHWIFSVRYSFNKIPDLTSMLAHGSPKLIQVQLPNISTSFVRSRQTQTQRLPHSSLAGLAHPGFFPPTPTSILFL